LPAKLQAHIREITKTSIVREQFQKTYSFQQPHDGRITLDMEISFEVKNFSDTTLAYAPELQEESVFTPGFVSLEIR